MQPTLSIYTKQHTALIPITRIVAEWVQKSGVCNGVLHLFVKHTTCGLTINENADPDVVVDLLHRLETLAPWELASDRHGEGNSAAHLKSSLLGSSVSVPIRDGHLVLGTWQGIYFGEFDGPRNRELHLTFLAAR